MVLFAVIVLVIVVPIGLLVWRRSSTGAEGGGADGQGNRDLGSKRGPPTSSPNSGWGSGDPGNF